MSKQNEKRDLSLETTFYQRGREIQGGWVASGVQGVSMKSRNNFLPKR